MNASPKSWKSDTPAARAAAWIFGTQSAKKPGSTWRAVSILKPSIRYLRIQSAKTSTSPCRTSACSVARSSSPKKSPSSRHAGGHEAEVDVAAVVVVRGVVEPRGSLHVALGRRHERRLRRAVLVARELDHVGGVVDDDVEDHLQPEPVRAVDEGAELRVRAEVRVDGGEVDGPVAVVPGAVGLDVLLPVRRRDPDRVEAEVADPREPARTGAVAGQAREVAAVVVAGVGRVEAADALRPDRGRAASFAGFPFAYRSGITK